MIDNKIQLQIVSFHSLDLPSNNNQDCPHQSSGTDMEKNQLQYGKVGLCIQAVLVVLAHNCVPQVVLDVLLGLLVLHVPLGLSVLVGQGNQGVLLDQVGQGVLLGQVGQGVLLGQVGQGDLLDQVVLAHN